MTDQELIHTLIRASESQDNIALKMLLIMAADRIGNLKKKNSEMSWQTNPDRSGGQFTEDEIDNSGRWI